MSFLPASPVLQRGERKQESINTGSRVKSGMTQNKNYFLSVSRLVRGKGVDLVVEVCNKLGLPLKVVGSGPELSKYQVSSIKYKGIEFLGPVSDEELAKLYGGSKALIIASEDEDFGITAVEAQAAGTPVIAPKSGGFLETVIPGKTGFLYEGPGMVSVDSLTEALQSFDETKFKAEALRKNADKFSKERFKKEILELVNENLNSKLDK